jgi:hypothetical protein
MLFPAPPMPEFPADHASTTERFSRYDDCTQDGRLIPIAIPPSLATLWQTTMAQHPGARNAIAAGVIGLLTRMTVTSLDAPIRVHRPIEATVGFQLAHDRDASGEVTRLFNNVWAEVRGRPGRSGTPRSSASTPGARVVAGHAFAEHTFTRPFAPAGQRRVTSFAGIAGYPELPPARYPAPPPTTAMEAPDGARWLDDLSPDEIDTVFTLDHTDANQHVNSQVYVRLFLDAVRRRLAASGHPAQLRSKAFDIAYRKPCFVGERVRAHVRLFACGDQLGGAGFIAAAGGEPEAKPRCYVRALFGA